MPEAHYKMKMPELLVFARVFAIWFVLAGCFRVTYFEGEKFATLLVGVDWVFQAAGITVCLIVCLAYAIMRDACSSVVRLGRSLRFDLLAFALIGVWSNYLTSSWLLKAQKVLNETDPRWAPTILVALLLALLSPLCRTYLSRMKQSDLQFYFLGDEEIDTEEEDILQIKGLAKDFAATVLASAAHSGLVFGVDGPWGAGKTSFVNLAENHWREAGSNSIIVFRFEPLRYAAEPDLSERFLRDLTATIQRQVYTPEFRPAASRYSRMIKGISLLGFKLSIEPLSKTIDELLEDIDCILKSIRRRVIVVIDDLDRLEAKTVNNVLFAIRRTFKLSQATYIICYDTENLVNGKEDGCNAREFLEKFVTVKLSLFVDSSTLRNFLLTDWKRYEHRFQSIPSDSMLKLASVLSELANILGDDISSNYIPLIGDMRKLKRFVNTLILLQLEKTDLGKTDFNRRDLINLILLHLNYPGLFRQIYSEETEERSGVFSAKRNFDKGDVKFSNAAEFENVVSDCKETTGQFLLRQVFDVKVLKIETVDPANECILRSRACFNSEWHRNLEKYLKLIVRFATPEPRETFKLYQDAVDRVKQGTLIASILKEPVFDLREGELAHDEFWRVLVSQSHDFTEGIAEDAITTLVEYLPRYSTLYSGEHGLRQRSISSLILLLDRAGWGRTFGRRRINTNENVVEIAQRIYGEGAFAGKGLIHWLASNERGALGWNDLMLFRLNCSADLRGQTYNVQRALNVHEDASAPTSGLLHSLALNGMREPSQKVFQLFRETFIETGRNFLAEVDNIPDRDFYGNSEKWLNDQSDQEEVGTHRLADQLLVARSRIKSFVIYQLANRDMPTGSGVGCGLYDESGRGDSGGISASMNKYIFDVCFNPSINKDNIYHFVDHCLRNRSSGVMFGYDEGFMVTEIGLASGLDPAELKKYWAKFGFWIKEQNLPSMDRRVVTSNYITTYSEALPKVFEVLDKMADAPLDTTYNS
ncbi:MAG: KAP family NTPase [Methylomonas sp.]|jgi:hypothetical protein